MLVHEHRTTQAVLAPTDQAANFNSLIASKSCTPPPTRLVVWNKT
ncbi:hypothetical protein J2X72_002550 [Phyllobacterium sp. 1468]|nr:hypothetical protein [Phyllobacterium sp. 1468]